MYISQMDIKQQHCNLSDIVDLLGSGLVHYIKVSTLGQSERGKWISRDTELVETLARQSSAPHGSRHSLTVREDIQTLGNYIGLLAVLH